MHVTFQLPWSLTHSFCRSTHHFWGQTHLPYTSDPPTLHLFQLQTATTARGEAAARRALHRCDCLVETRRLVPPNGWWGLWLTRCTSWVDFFRNSTDDCLSCQPDDRPRGFFRIFPPTLEQISPNFTYPGAKLTYPVPEPTYPIPDSFFSPSPTRLPRPNLTYPRPTFFFTKSNQLPWTKTDLP